MKSTGIRYNGVRLYFYCTSSCKWDNRDCRDEFKQIMTDFGVCYIFNGPNSAPKHVFQTGKDDVYKQDDASAVSYRLSTSVPRSFFFQNDPYLDHRHFSPDYATYETHENNG